MAPVTRVTGQDLGARKGEISSQIDGQAIRGIVLITGNTLVEGLIFWELNYGFENDATGTWFLISESGQPIEDDLLAEWDTTQITDGNYNLRLTLFLEGDRRSHTTIKNLRIRNYSPIETDMPQPTLTSTPETDLSSSEQTQAPTQFLNATELLATLTPMPTNSLEIPQSDISNSMIRGAAGVLALFIIIGLYSTLKKSLGK